MVHFSPVSRPPKRGWFSISLLLLSATTFTESVVDEVGVTTFTATATIGEGQTCWITWRATPCGMTAPDALLPQGLQLECLQRNTLLMTCQDPHPEHEIGLPDQVCGRGETSGDFNTNEENSNHCNRMRCQFESPPQCCELTGETIQYWIEGRPGKRCPIVKRKDKPCVPRQATRYESSPVPEYRCGRKYELPKGYAFQGYASAIRVRQTAASSAFAFASTAAASVADIVSALVKTHAVGPVPPASSRVQDQAERTAPHRTAPHRPTPRP